VLARIAFWTLLGFVATRSARKSQSVSQSDISRSRPALTPRKSKEVLAFGVLANAPKALDFCSLSHPIQA
jgi:hypothetical protein